MPSGIRSNQDFDTPILLARRHFHTQTRRQPQPGPRIEAKPGSLLKDQIPIRTFADWNDAEPGFVEIDLIAHDGGVAAGEYCYTLTMTDIATGWTVNRSVPNKARVWVIQAIDHAAGMFPFPIRGIDSDNGSEFINHHLLHYCEQHKITFTRGRAGKKNDGCYVEQKNWARVRELVGYYRYDTAAELELLNEIWHAASRGIDMRHHGLVREVPSGVTTTRAGTGRAPPTASRQAGRTAAASRLVSKIRLARLQTPSGAGATR